MKKLIFILLLAAAPLFAHPPKQKVIDDSCVVSIMVDTEYATGSGVVFTRKDWNGEPISFVWTAGHVVEDPFTSILKLFLDGEGVKIDQKFEDVNILNGENKAKGHVIAYDEDQDVALLVLDHAWEGTVTFALDDYKPKIGQPVYAITSPRGLENSYCSGEVSALDRDTEIKGVLDQFNLVVWPGSSGGAVFNYDGQYIGMPLAMMNANLVFVAPIRQIEDWAEKNNLLWALNPDVPMPSEEDFRKLKP